MTASNDRIRLTISVSPDVHAAFSKMAEASGLSLSRVMGDWLADTNEAAQLVAQKMQQARAAPGLVLRELHAMTMGVADSLVAEQEARRALGGMRSSTGGARQAPRPSNTGGKVPTKAGKAGAGGRHG